MAGEVFNACEYLLDRRVEAGDGDRLALTGVGGDVCSSASVARLRACARSTCNPSNAC